MAIRDCCDSRNWPMAGEPYPEGSRTFGDTDGLRQCENLGKLKTRPLWRNNYLRVSIEGPPKSGISKIIYDLLELPWMSTVDFYMDDFTPVKKLVTWPRCEEIVFWYAPFLRRAEVGPDGKWRAVGQNPRCCLSQVTERSTLSYQRVIWPLIDALEGVKGRNHNPVMDWDLSDCPYRRPYQDPIVLDREFSLTPDVIIVLDLPADYLIRRMGLDSDFEGIATFLNHRHLQLYHDFPGPKFLIDGSQRNLANLSDTVKEICAWIKILQFGCPRAGLGGH